MGLQPGEVETYRRELVGYCYRYFASYAEAEDAAQEVIVRAWQRAETFEQRASVRTWLYKIATNICLDMNRAPQRRSLPMDLASPGQVPDDPTALTTRAEQTWIGPAADANLGIEADPSAAAMRRESVRLAFIWALQQLPARQRAVLILRDVLAWSAQECADLLETTVASVNSALARARKTIDDRDVASVLETPAEYDTQLLMNYVAAFEAFDVDRMVKLLADDATFTMPPFELWLRGAPEIARWWRGPGQVCRNARTRVTSANGAPAVAVYHDAGADLWEPFAIHVLDTHAGQIRSITQFIGAQHFVEFGMPTKVRAQNGSTS